METRKLGSLWCQIEAKGKGLPLFVALHGRGGSARDINLLGNTLCPGSNMVFPDGPMHWPPEQPHTGRAWYSRSLRKRKEELRDSREALLSCLKAARELLQPGPVILCGFSQGAVMTLDAGLRSPGPADLLIALSGFLYEDLGDAGSPPTLVINGTQDDIISVDLGRDANHRLRDRGVPVTYREFDTDHSIRHEVVRAVKLFIQESRLLAG